MAQFTIRSNIKDVEKHIREKHTQTIKEVEKEVKTTAKDIRSMLYARTPRGETGGARSAFTNSPKGGVEAIFEVQPYEAKIGGRIPLERGYELFDLLEGGTRAHGPVTAKALHFFIDGEEIFAKKVKGIRPMKIFARTRMHWRSTWPPRLKRAVKRGLGR